MHPDESSRQFLRLETQFWTALQARDETAAAALSAEPTVVVGAQGVAVIDRQALAAMVRNPSFTLESFELQDARVVPVTDDVVIVAYRASEKLVVDGEPVSLEACDSSVWVRRGERWECVLHTESPAGDPYGRSR